MLEIIDALIAIDSAIFHFINNTISNPVTNFVMPIITKDLYLKIILAVSLSLLLWKGDKRLRWAVLFSLIVVTLTDQASSAVLKPLIERLRPCKIMEVNLLVGGCGAGFSMPSSHAANLFGQAYLFLAVHRKTACYLIPFAILVALSRVFVGVHYPADIICGAALGTLIGFGIGKLYQYIDLKYFSIGLDKDAIEN